MNLCKSNDIGSNIAISNEFIEEKVNVNDYLTNKKGIGKSVF